MSAHLALVVVVVAGLVWGWVRFRDRLERWRKRRLARRSISNKTRLERFGA